MRHPYSIALNAWCSIVLNAACSVAVVLLLANTAFGQSPSAENSERPPRLAAIEWRESSVSVRVRGTDPAAPRSLTLFRFRQERFERVASTSSRADGRFDFGEIIVSQENDFFAVSPESEAPRIDRLVRIERPVPSPRVSASLETPSDVLIHPARLEGELRFREDGTGRLLARLRIDATRPRSTRIDLNELLGRAAPVEIRIEQVLDNGRVSESTFFRFERTR
jgi:hypothetical protein